MTSKDHGHGLEPEDVDLLFPDSAEGSQEPERIVDYKRRQSGERSEEIEGPDDEEAPVQEIDEGEALRPTFKDEAWPSPIEDAPENGYEPDPGEVDLAPGRERRTAVQELGKATGRAMVDDPAAPKPKPLVGVPGARQPSDREWATEIKKILGGRPCLPGL